MSDKLESLIWRLLSVRVCRDARCAFCGSPRDLVPHHRVPRAFGGRDLPSNLEPVCRSCHPKAEVHAFVRAVAVGRDRVRTG
jgi:5-methylcytosine-specific restriction endonuclease McrA